MNKEVELQIEDALALGKLLHRVIFSNPLPKDKTPYVKINIEGIRMTIEEMGRLKKVVQIMDDLVKQHREQARKDLEALGERLFMEGDGILKVEHLSGDVEYRAFAQTISGTSYLGAFPTEDAARAVWQTLTKKATEVEVFQYRDDGDEWDLVQVAELTGIDLEPDVQFDLDKIHIDDLPDLRPETD